MFWNSNWGANITPRLESIRAFGIMPMEKGIVKEVRIRQPCDAISRKDQKQKGV
jgi:hypothetical protein